MTTENQAPEPQNGPSPGNKKVKTQFPPPRFTLVRDTDKGKNCHKLISYWLTDLNKPSPSSDSGEMLYDFVEARIYRCHPIIDLKLVEPDRKNVVFEFIFGKCPITDPHNYQQWFLDKWGAGDWKIVINEKGVSGSIMECVFKARGLEGAAEDFDTYPPKLDYRTIVNCEENRSYIEWRRRQNLPLPWDNPEGEEFTMTVGSSAPQQGSAADEVLRTVTQSNEKLTDKLIEQTERVADARVEALQDQVNSSGPNAQMAAAQASIEMVTKTADRVVEMVTQHSGKQYDPVEMFKTTAEILDSRAAQVPADPSIAHLDRVIGLMQASSDRMLGFYQQHCQSLENMLKESRDAARSQAQSEPRKTFLQELREQQEMAELMGWARKGESTAVVPAIAQAPQGPGWFNEQTAPIIIMGVQTMFVIAANIVYNWAAVKFKTGEPKSPGEALREANEQAAKSGGGGATIINAKAEHVEEDPKEKLREEWKKFIESFTPAFIGQLYTDDPQGYKLALFLQTDGTMGGLTQNGRRNYLAIRDTLGRKGFEALMRGHTDLWAKVGGHPKLKVFLDDFFRCDEIMQELAAKKAAAPPEEQKQAA